ncbi:MAG TPA: CBS domain-containing protein [Bryobacteraceae bacterium]|nr:CBS domain-containing protein [Bryobacteraceae bacterium]
MDTVGSMLRHKGSDIFWLSPEATVYEAVAMMADKGVGALLVIAAGKLAGIVSERDYARKVILKGKHSHEIQVKEIMTSPVFTVTPEHSVEDCMRIITAHRIRHLPVMKGDALKGMISIGDVVRSIISAQAHTIDQLSGYIEGRYPA